jgi:hypothetical protein
MDDRIAITLLRALRPAAQRDFLASEEFQALPAEAKARVLAAVPDIAEAAQHSRPEASTGQAD